MCVGLGNKEKRKAIFRYCKDRADIAFLQETHSTTDNCLEWSKEWRGKIYFSHGESNARGVCILIKDTCDMSFNNIDRDSEGRYIVGDLKNEMIDIALCNVYGPNHDKPDFFEKIAKALEDRSEHKIIMGDFNASLNKDLDKLNSTGCTKARAIEVIFEMMSEFQLVEVWRVRNEGKKQFSWEKRINGKLEQASRIDYALVTRGLESSIENTMYLEAPLTDHTAFFISV